MPFPYDKYPWLNFQELNLAYFIKHFREIFQQWDQLYHDLLDWKDATDADLAEWKTAVEFGISSWETGLTAALEVWKSETESGLATWKTQTESDIAAWETATLVALDAWKTATTAVFEQIRTEAAASATAAAGSASAAETAKTAAQTAQAAAEAAAAGIASELAQIQTNAADISDLQDALSPIEKVLTIPNIADKNSFTDGKLMPPNGTMSDNANYSVTPKYAVNPGETIYFTPRVRTVVAYNDQESPIAASGINGDSSEYTVPEGIYYIACTVYTNQKDVFMLSRKKYDQYFPFNKEHIEAEYIEPYTDAADQVIITPNIFNKDNAISGYMTADGTIRENQAYIYYGYLIVNPGETYYFTPKAHFICAYNENYHANSASGINNQDITEYTVPEGIRFLFVSTYSAYLDEFMISKYSGIPYTPYNTPYIVRSFLPELSQISENTNEIAKLKTIKKNYYSLKDDSMSANDALVIEKNLPIKNGTLIRFSGTVGANFNGIEIGFTDDISQADLTHFKIDSTKVYRVTSNPFETEHDLTISGNLVISLEQTYTHLKLHVECNGSTYETSSGWAPSNAYPYIKVLSAFSDCSFSLTAKKNKSHITIFGDSYVSYGVERWPYYLAENSFDDNSSIVGYSGERSDAAYKNFTDFMPINSPKFVVWALGMNDTDTGGAINSAWKTAIDAVIEYCNANNITPVLCTIPNVPNQDNSLKNAYVRSFEGTYPIIDFAKAVGSDISSSWFTGMLSNDNVHPTALGAIALYNRAITDFPELCVTK